MTWVDAVLAAVVVVSAFIAFFRGLVREVLSLGAWLGAAVAAFFARPFLLPYLAEFLDPPWVADAAGAAIAFLVVLVVLKLLTNAIADVVQESMLGGLDRVLGLAFGAARGVFLLVLAYIIAGMFAPATDTWPDAVKQSRGLPMVAEGAHRLVEFLPEAYRPRLVDAPQSGGVTIDDLLRPPAGSRN